LERGLITPEQLGECLREQASLTAQGTKSLLGKLLIERGYLKTEAVLEILQEQTRRSQGIPNLSRYEVQEKVGEGATAIVYRAFDRELKRSVALKVLREGPGMSEIGRGRFRREAQTAAVLAHPNVVQVYDAGEAEGQHYIVMELVKGRPLSAILAEGRASREELIGILEQAARGVAAAHEKEIVHRDLKPANILVSDSGEPKVGDFGLAHLSEGATVLTKTGSTLGTPLYMSPEQVEGRSKDITARTDVYALGAILYEILTRRPPHAGDTVAEIYGKIVNEEPAAPRKLDAKVSADLETIALKALEKIPENRYPTAEVFAEDLKRALTGEPIQARPISAPQWLWRKALKHRRIFILGTTLVAMGILLGVMTSRKTGTSGQVAFFEDLTGDVRTVRPGIRSTATVGQVLVGGQGVETGPAPSMGVVRFGDGTRVEIGPDTCVDRVAFESGKHLVLTRGTIRATVPKLPRDERMIFTTLQGEARATDSTLRLSVCSDAQKGTRVEAEQGKVEVRDLAGRAVMVEVGHYTVAAAAMELVATEITLTLKLGDGIGMETVYIKPGTFTMGGTTAPEAGWEADRRPMHRVVLTKGFALGKYLVTRGQFGAFVRATGYQTDAERNGKMWGRTPQGEWKEIPGNNWRTPVGFVQSDDHPAVCITWNDAKAFCDWATKVNGRTVTLPTEAEWEYTCRAGTKTRWSFGDQESAYADHEWCSSNSGMQTHPVGQKKPNPWGLYDMNGNVHVWCQDFAGPYSGDTVDPTGPATGESRIMRGGNWRIGPVAPGVRWNAGASAGGGSGTGFRVCIR
jgi:formylglycine-generating enzyme required for sulfatase activity/tRNA A-37 threonylcarbamoyl transferase component Bud32